MESSIQKNKNLSENRRESIIEIIDFSISNLSVENLTDETIAYGLRNYIAKYSLSKNTHLISEKAYKQIKNNDTFFRCHKKKFKVKFEHLIPSKVILEHLINLKINNNYNISNLIHILNLTDMVTIITKEENDLLDTNNEGECLRSKLANNNTINEKTIFSRYKKVGIKLLKNNNEIDGFHKIIMEGAIYR
jgi:hypothetical protein